MKTIISTEQAPRAIGPYSQAVVVPVGAQRMVFCSGQVALEPATGQLLAGDVSAQTKLALLESRQAESQSQQAALEALYRELAPSRDEWALHWGARALVRKLRALGITVRHEEFDDGHMNIPYRYDVSVPFLVDAILAG